ncbi:phospholipase ABHD3-like [Glandiceps talaboti]
MSTSSLMGSTEGVLSLKLHKPRLIGKDKYLMQFLCKHCPSLTANYWPTLWCYTARANTIVKSLLSLTKSISHLKYRREILVGIDGGEVVLDWHDNDSCGNSGTSRQTGSNDGALYRDNHTRPTVIILPGLTGDASQGYILEAVDDITRLGYRSVVFNYRGSGGTKLKTPRYYCGANTDDINTAICHIKLLYPDSQLMAVGISFGGMILMNYLAKTGEESGLMAAMVISTIWNVFKTTESLETSINKVLFNKMLTSKLLEDIKCNREMFSQKFDVDQILQCKTIRDFDERVTCDMFGYKDVNHFYKEASTYYKLGQVQIPVLCLQAADDPFSPACSLPLQEAQQHPNIVFAVTSYGGHIGFCEGWFPRNKNYMDRVLSQYVDAVFKYTDIELNLKKTR